MKRRTRHGVPEQGAAELAPAIRPVHRQPPEPRDGNGRVAGKSLGQRRRHLREGDVRSLVADLDLLGREYWRRPKESDADRNCPSRRVRQSLDGVRRGISRPIDAYQDVLVGKREFGPRLKARERQQVLEKELTVAVDQERDKDHSREVLGGFRAFAAVVEASPKDAD